MTFNNRPSPATSHPFDETRFDQVPPLDVVGMLKVVWYGKWVIAGAILLAVLCAGYFSFRIAQPRFAATATLQVDAQPTHLGDVSQHWPNPATDLASLNTEVTILTSDAILSRVIAAHDLMQDPEFNRYLTPTSPYAISTLRGHLRAAITGVTQPAPDATYIAEKTVQNLRGSISANRPHDTYLFQITARSRDADKAALIANSAAAAYIAAQVEAKETAANAAIVWLTGRVADLRAQLERQETAVTDLIATVQIQQDADLDLLSGTVLAIDQERASLAATLATFDGLTNATPRQTSQVAQLQAQIAAVDAQRARLQTQLATQSTGMVTLQQMQREADATRVLYQSFLSRLQETQVQRGLDYADSRLVTPATTGQYIGPRKMLIVNVAAIVGALLGLMIVALRHIGRKGALHPEDLRLQTGKPVFGQIGQSPLRNLKRVLKSGKSGQHLPVTAKIKAGLMLGSGGHMPQVTLATATTAGEGHIALGLAMSQATGANAGSVLCLCADPQARAQVPLPKGFSAPASLGATPVFDPLLGCDVLRLDDVNAVLDAHFAAKLGQLRADYAHIIILAPPVVAAPETLLLARYADAVLMCVRWARTPVPAVQQSIAMLEGASDAPIGLTLTRTHVRKMRRFAGLSGAPFAALELG